MTETYRSEAMTAVHEMVEGFHESGAVDEQTMREFDEACLKPASLLAPEETKGNLGEESRLPAGALPISESVEEPSLR